jgi:hypothetical protein
MKKSKQIKLVLITAALASCSHKEKEWVSGNRTYVRSDSTAPYSRTHAGAGFGLWYYAFRPYGYYNNGLYNRNGYYSNAIHPSGNFGSNTGKSAVSRGGFGRSGFSVSS